MLVHKLQQELTGTNALCSCEADYPKILPQLPAFCKSMDGIKPRDQEALNLLKGFLLMKGFYYHLPRRVENGCPCIDYSLASGDFHIQCFANIF